MKPSACERDPTARPNLPSPSPPYARTGGRPGPHARTGAPPRLLLALARPSFPARQPHAVTKITLRTGRLVRCSSNDVSGIDIRYASGTFSPFSSTRPP